MSWWSWLFPNSQRTRVEKIVRRDPIGGLVIAIVTAAWQCSQRVKPYLPPVNKFAEHPEVQDMFVLYEFLYFFLHLMNRQAHTRLGSNIVAALQNEVGPLIVPTAVDTFAAHWPEKYKSGIAGEFYENLNNAEMEYASCKLLFPEKKPIDDRALCSRLAINVLRLPVYDTDLQRLSNRSLRLVDYVGALVMDNLESGPLKDLGEMVERAGIAIKRYGR